MVHLSRRNGWLPALLGLTLALGACARVGGRAGGSDASTSDNNNSPVSCGNALIDPGETCDDGNLVNGDGCSASCQLEVCDAASCPTGCCDSQGNCLGGAQDDACGVAGVNCQNCQSDGLYCQDHTCWDLTSCTDGDELDCGNCGIRRCYSGTWGACEDQGECAVDQIEFTGGCGNCGSLQRACQSDCTWGVPTCENEGICGAGDVEIGGACGNNGHEERVCNATTCEWEAWTCEGEGTCTDGAVETGADCGNCGHQERTCTAGVWGAWTCVGEGVCVANSVDTGGDCGNCGHQERTCDPVTCQWGSWACLDEGECSPNATQTGSTCGNCGTEERTCSSSTCMWGNWSCVDQGSCVAGTVQTGSTCNGTGTEERTCSSSTCEWGSWICVGGCSVAGHMGTGENADPCNQSTQDERWRCVWSNNHGAWASQVCRDYYDPGVEWVWIIYHLNPSNCEGCCESYSSACAQ